jgi:hypothetical protein
LRYAIHLRFPLALLREAFLSGSGEPLAVPIDRPQLFLAVLLRVSLYRFFSMTSAMNYVAPRSVSVVRRLFMMSGIVVLGRLLVVVGGMFKML